MNIKKKELGQIVIFEVSGKIMGGPDADAFHNEIKASIAQGRKQILVNLSKVNWINSTGLGILIAGYTSIRDAGGEFKLALVPERIQSILMVTKLASIFESYETEEEALATFATA